LVALLGAALEWLSMGRVNFVIVSTGIVLAMLWVLHRAQRRNNRAIAAKLDALIARQSARGRQLE
jgi:low affinity Fe/Cu permease